MIRFRQALKGFRDYCIHCGSFKDGSDLVALELESVSSKLMITVKLCKDPCLYILGDLATQSLNHDFEAFGVVEDPLAG